LRFEETPRVVQRAPHLHDSALEKGMEPTMGGNDGGFHAWRIEIFTFDEKAAKDQGSLTNLRLETNKNTQ